MGAGFAEAVRLGAAVARNRREAASCSGTRLNPLEGKQAAPESSAPRAKGFESWPKFQECFVSGLFSMCYRVAFLAAPRVQWCKSAVRLLPRVAKYNDIIPGSGGLLCRRAPQRQLGSRSLLLFWPVCFYAFSCSSPTRWRVYLPTRTLSYLSGSQTRYFQPVGRPFG